MERADSALQEEVTATATSTDPPPHPAPISLISPRRRSRDYHGPPFRFILAVQALGVVYGDIGTSPLYVMNTIFTAPPSKSDAIGGCSLVIWSLLILVTLKYALLILLADNHGEGGTFALAGLLLSKKSCLNKPSKLAVSVLSILGASLLLGDGAFTPAVSVLSAVGGIATGRIGANLDKWVVPITVAILGVLFLVQFLGTHRVGATFGPVISIWFAAIGGIGIYQLTKEPSAFRALNPWEGLRFLGSNGDAGFRSLGSVFLAVTGLEVLYADLGHFGATAVRVSWLSIALPALSLQYLGQTALLVRDPLKISAIFYNAVPGALYYPMLVLATLATVIASQAVITGSFLLASQAVSLNYAPPVPIKRSDILEAYFEEGHWANLHSMVNFVLMAITLALVGEFRTDTRITNAYGVTVCMLMVLTTFLYMGVMRYVWNKPVWMVSLFALFLLVDLLFLSSVLLKIPQGGWVAILVSSVFFAVLLSWFVGERKGRRFMRSHARSTPLAKLESRFVRPAANSAAIVPETGDQPPPITLASRVDEASSSSGPRLAALPRAGNVVEMHMRGGESALVARLPGIGVFLAPNAKATPHAFEQFVACVHGIPETLMFLRVVQSKMAIVTDAERLCIQPFRDATYLVIAEFGFSEHRVDVETLLLDPNAQEQGLPAPREHDGVTFYIPMENIQVSAPWFKFWKWHLHLYAVMKRLFPITADGRHVRLPIDRTIGVGMVIKIN